MNPIELIFKLLLKFGALEEERYPALLAKAKFWWFSIVTDDKEMSDEEKKYQSENQTELQNNPTLIKFKKFSNQWYAQVLNAILYIFLVRQIYDYMNPKDDTFEK